MRNRFTLKEGDTSPALDVRLTDENGQAIDLTNADVQFVMTEALDSTPTVDAPATIVDASAGDVEYRWVDGDTDIPGIYEGEFVITYADGHDETVPSDGYVYVRIRGGLN